MLDLLALPAPRVRALTLGAVVVLVVVECGGGTCAARHTATGAFGYGADEEAALPSAAASGRQIATQRFLHIT